MPRSPLRRVLDSTGGAAVLGSHTQTGGTPLKATSSSALSYLLAQLQSSKKVVAETGMKVSQEMSVEVKHTASVFGDERRAIMNFFTALSAQPIYQQLLALALFLTCAIGPLFYLQYPEALVTVGTYVLVSALSIAALDQAKRWNAALIATTHLPFLPLLAYLFRAPAHHMLVNEIADVESMRINVTLHVIRRWGFAAWMYAARAVLLTTIVTDIWTLLRNSKVAGQEHTTDAAPAVEHPAQYADHSATAGHPARASRKKASSHRSSRAAPVTKQHPAQLADDSPAVGHPARAPRSRSRSSAQPTSSRSISRKRVTASIDNPADHLRHVVPTPQAPLARRARGAQVKAP